MVVNLFLVVIWGWLNFLHLFVHFSWSFTHLEVYFVTCISDFYCKYIEWKLTFSYLVCRIEAEPKYKKHKIKVYKVSLVAWYLKDN